MANFNFEYMGDYLQYKDSQGNTLIVNGGIINETATGAVAEITDGAENIPVKSLTVTLEPIQDLHGQANPYPAGGGKNLLNAQIRNAITVNGITSQVYANDRVTISGTSTGSGDCNIDITPISIGAGESITISWTGRDTRSTSVAVFLHDGNSFYTYKAVEATYHSVTFDIADATTVGKLLFRTYTDGTIDFDCSVQIEKGTTATTFAPYENICPISGHSTVNVWRESTYDTSAEPVISIQLGDTIYGATVNVTSGVLTVSMVTVDLGTLTWRHCIEVGSGIFSSNTDGIVDYLRSNSVKGKCSKYKYHGAVGGVSAMVDFEDEIAVYVGSDNTHVIYLNDTRYANLTDFVRAIQGVQFCYELAQPITVQLTAEQLTTLLGTNYIWSDADSVSVDYVADTKLYIQNAISTI